MTYQEGAICAYMICTAILVHRHIPKNYSITLGVGLYLMAMFLEWTR